MPLIAKPRRKPEQQDEETPRCDAWALTCANEKQQDRIKERGSNG